MLNDKKSRKAVELAERFADGLAEATELKRTWEQVSGHVVCGAVCAPVSSAVVWVSEQAAARVTRGLEGQHHSATDAMFLSERSAQADLVRDIFGNPFRPVTFSPSWRTDTAVTLARQMYESRDFGAMPILADALQDAGCDNADILTHCRCDGPLVRGCWVCDLVLGKE